MIRGLAFSKSLVELLASGVREIASLDSLCWNSRVTDLVLLVIPCALATKKSLCARFSHCSGLSAQIREERVYRQLPLRFGKGGN